MTGVRIRPFVAAVDESALVDLRDRLARTRWPDAETVDDWSQGVPLRYLQEVCDHWATSYDWRRVEARLNACDQVLATVDGVDVHVLSVRSEEPGARPLVMTHGWPGSVLEFLDVLGPLTDPRAHGGDPADAFHVVCPSLPGYGFSGRPTTPGWNAGRIADAWVRIMAALGHDRFLAQGGDWGSLVTHELALRHAEHVEGVHVNLGLCDPRALARLGEPTEEERRQLAKARRYQREESGYSKQQTTRPQTLGYGLHDSPVGQCAWILDKFAAWTDCDGHPENVLSRDTMLDTITLYWLTGTATSSSRLYWESFGAARTSTDPLPVPVGYTVFPEDLSEFSERWARTRYPDLRHYARAPRGGHFAALEQPAIFVDEVRTAFRAMR